MSVKTYIDLLSKTKTEIQLVNEKNQPVDMNQFFAAVRTLIESSITDSGTNSIKDKTLPLVSVDLKKVLESFVKDQVSIEILFSNAASKRMLELAAVYGYCLSAISGRKNLDVISRTNQLTQEEVEELNRQDIINMKLSAAAAFGYSSTDTIISLLRNGEISKEEAVALGLPKEEADLIYEERKLKEH